MQNNCLSQDTSAYWRKLLKIDAPLPEGFVKKTDSFLSVFRPGFNSFIEILAHKLTALSSEGAKDLPAAPFILASNHSSILDFPAVFFCLPKDLREKTVAIYKVYYDKNPMAKFFIKLFTKSLSVDMDKKPWEALSAAATVLRSGYCLYIAPEGTRSKGGEVLPFKPGVGTLAVETKTPVVPVFIKGADKVLPRGSFIPKKNAIKVIFGKAIDLSVFFDKKEFCPAYDVYKEAADLIRQRILELSQ
ncbi:MAG: lysophospholipid acyltransferase family protein [Candidatus Margulisiibacteriota bacterium]